MAASSYSAYNLLEGTVTDRIRTFLNENNYYAYRAQQTRSFISSAWSAGSRFSGETWKRIFENFIIQSVVAYLDVFRRALPYIAFHHSTARAMTAEIQRLGRTAIRSGLPEDFRNVEELLSKTRPSCGLPAFDEIIELTPDRSAGIIEDIRDMTMNVLEAGPKAERRLMLLDMKRFLVPGAKFDVASSPHDTAASQGTMPLDVAIEEQTKLSSMFMSDIVLFSRKVGEAFVRNVRAGCFGEDSDPPTELYIELEKVLLHVLAAKIYEEMMPDIVAYLINPTNLPPSAGCMTTALDDRIRDIIRGEARRVHRVRKRNRHTGVYYTAYK